MDPLSAIKKGATYIIIGRPITEMNKHKNKDRNKKKKEGKRQERQTRKETI